MKMSLKSNSCSFVYPSRISHRNIFHSWKEAMQKTLLGSQSLQLWNTCMASCKGNHSLIVCKCPTNALSWPPQKTWWETSKSFNPSSTLRIRLCVQQSFTIGPYRLSFKNFIPSWRSVDQSVTCSLQRSCHPKPIRSLLFGFSFIHLRIFAGSTQYLPELQQPCRHLTSARDYSQVLLCVNNGFDSI